MAAQALTITIDRFPSQSRYDVDDAVLLRATVRDALTGALVDPDTMAFRTKNPDGLESSYSYQVDDEVTRASAGIYEFTVLLDAPNDWSAGAVARVAATGRGATNLVLAVCAPEFTIEPVDPGGASGDTGTFELDGDGFFVIDGDGFLQIFT